MVSESFDFAFARSYRLPAAVLGIRPSTTSVTVDRHELVVRFGLWRLRTPLSNVVDTEITGGFAWLKTAGPPHLSFADRGITFATNGERALCISFAEPVSGIDPTGRIVHPGATVTVADPGALRAALIRGT